MKKGAIFMPRRYSGSFLAGLIFLSAVLAALALSAGCNAPAPLEEKSGKQVVAKGQIKGEETACKSDGSPPDIYYDDSGTPSGFMDVGDHFKMEYAESFELTFTPKNSGEDSKMTAQLEHTIEYLSPGLVVTFAEYGDYEEMVKRFGGAVKKHFGTNTTAASTQIETAQAEDIPPKYQTVYDLEFTGGPNGVFSEPSGKRQHPLKGAIRGEIHKDESTQLYYVQFDDPISARLDISDPDVFKEEQ